MNKIAARLSRLEQRHEAVRENIVTLYDGPYMTLDEMDEYNRTRRPDQPFMLTLRIDRANDHADR